MVESIEGKGENADYRIFFSSHNNLKRPLARGVMSRHSLCGKGSNLHILHSFSGCFNSFYEVIISHVQYPHVWYLPGSLLDGADYG